MIACREKMGKGRLESRIFMVVKKIKGSLYYSLNFDFFLFIFSFNLHSFVIYKLFGTRENVQNEGFIYILDFFWKILATHGCKCLPGGIFFFFFVFFFFITKQGCIMNMDSSYGFCVVLLVFAASFDKWYIHNEVIVIYMYICNVITLTILGAFSIIYMYIYNAILCYFFISKNLMNMA